MHLKKMIWPQLLAALPFDTTTLLEQGEDLVQQRVVQKQQEQ